MLNDENWCIAFFSVRIWVSLNPGEFLREPFEIEFGTILLNLGQFYWLIGSHDTIHLKMALKTILIFLEKSSTSDKGSCSLEVDKTASELSSNPPKKKFPHVYQDENVVRKGRF